MKKYYIYDKFPHGKLIKETYSSKEAKKYKEKGYHIRHKTKGGTSDRKLLQMDK
tara:strand:+ start:539 stop:700 length:162 start_codon:yes stop_codon:yes gene_type:complete